MCKYFQMILNIIFTTTSYTQLPFNFRFSDLHGDCLGLPYLFIFLARRGACHMPTHKIHFIYLKIVGVT